MIDREKVISNLSSALVQMHGCGRYTPEDVDELETAAWGALKLLEEQEPKSVKATKNVYNYLFCPNCGRGFELKDYKKLAYCSECGQAVKWE